MVVMSWATHTTQKKTRTGSSSSPQTSRMQWRAGTRAIHRRTHRGTVGHPISGRPASRHENASPSHLWRQGAVVVRLAARPRCLAVAKENTKIPPRAASYARPLTPLLPHPQPSHAQNGGIHPKTPGNSDEVSGVTQKPHVQPPRHHQQAICWSVPPELRHQVKCTAQGYEGLVPNGGDVTLHHPGISRKSQVQTRSTLGHALRTSKPALQGRTNHGQADAHTVASPSYVCQ